MENKVDFEAIIRENYKRNKALECEYDPERGIGCCGERVPKAIGGKVYMMPSKLVDYMKGKRIRSKAAWDKERIKYDFEFWCATAVKIKDKISGKIVPYRLNAPQRKVLAVLEQMRESGNPIRMILLKARQWGGSTLVQIYMAWIQITQKTDWNSLICGHLKDASSAIKGMYSRLLDNYPETYSADVAMKFKNFEKSRNVSEITGRGCLVIIGSSETQESVRGYDISMAHLTEVAFWRSSNLRNPENVVRSVCGSVPLEAYTVVVMESTANGVGNFFHTEWLRAKAGTSDKKAVFVPWYEIEIYRKPIRESDVPKLWSLLDAYELGLWNKGLTLEMIAWYHSKRKEYFTDSQMRAEYPTDDIEAFANTGDNVFDMSDIERLRVDCFEPLYRGELIGDGREGVEALCNLHFDPIPNGEFKVWRKPDPIKGYESNRYIVTVDIGGIGDKSDWSVIAVIDRLSSYRKPEIVAQWRGHTFHDLLAWKAAQIATWYNNALLVIESNTLETEYTEGDGSGYILDLIGNVYGNMYKREPSVSNPAGERRPGFHTNVKTKNEVIYSQMRIMRDSLYVEHDAAALDEYATYEKKRNGSYGAIDGKHDDILMTRCIGLYVASKESTFDYSRTTAISLKPY